MATVSVRTLQGSRKLCSVAGATSAVRHRHTLTAADGAQSQPQQQQQQQQQKLHQVASNPVTPTAAFIPLPPNVEELQASEKARFSPRRNRDISSKLNQVGGIFGSGFMGSQGSQSNTFNTTSSPSDARADIYDAHNTVSLSSVMQSNVPKPYEISGKAPVHLNMPGGQWAQDEKYLSGELQTCHHSKISSRKNTGIPQCNPLGLLVTNFGASRRGLSTWCGSEGGGRIVGLNTHCLFGSNPVRLINTPVRREGCFCCCSKSINISSVQLKDEGSKLLIHKLIHTSSVRLKDETTSSEQLTSRQKLQRAVKEYGTTVIVFHVTISLVSLGICYLLVSSGVDMTGLFKTLGINMAKFGEGASQVSGETAVEIEQATSQSVQATSQTEQATLQTEEGGVENSDLDINTKRAAGAATFVVAYAVHKVFAPARIAITLTSTPFIVRHLRKIGFLKPPKPKIS